MPVTISAAPSTAPTTRVLTKILCVDDEPQVLEGLARHLRRHYELFTATSGIEALNTLRQETAIAVIVSDMRMPGMDGAAFLAKSREVAPDAVRILLTGHADISAAVAAPALASAVEAAATQHRLITAERVLLEETLHGSIKALADVLALTNPVAFGRAMRIRQHVSDLAVKLGMRERWQVEVAAMLSQIGTIALPPETAEKAYEGRPLSADEQQMVDRVPAVAEQLLGSIPRLEAVRGIIAALYKKPGRPAVAANTDDALIARGAQLLRIATDFDALEAEGNSLALALDTMLGRADRYDTAMLRAFEEIRGVHKERDEVRQVSLASLQVGMVLQEDVRLLSGTLLAGRGYEVTSSFVERARNCRGSVVKDSVRVVMPRRSLTPTT
jgi:response regulator RpfG family c-di-GMP phosphodiesterase